MVQGRDAARQHALRSGRDLQGLRVAGCTYSAMQTSTRPRRQLRRSTRPSVQGRAPVANRASTGTSGSGAEPAATGFPHAAMHCAKLYLFDDRARISDAQQCASAAPSSTAVSDSIYCNYRRLCITAAAAANQHVHVPPNSIRLASQVSQASVIVLFVLPAPWHCSAGGDKIEIRCGVTVVDAVEGKRAGRGGGQRDRVRKGARGKQGQHVPPKGEKRGVSAARPSASCVPLSTL